MMLNHCKGRPGHTETKIGYILSRFPSLNMTFVEREVFEVKRRGINLVVVAIRPPAGWEKRLGVMRAIEGTKYIFPLRWARQE